MLNKDPKPIIGILYPTWSQPATALPELPGLLREHHPLFLDCHEGRRRWDLGISDDSRTRGSFQASPSQVRVDGFPGMAMSNSSRRDTMRITATAIPRIGLTVAGVSDRGSEEI
jgi:hypothetical protein